MKMQCFSFLIPPSNHSLDNTIDKTNTKTLTSLTARFSKRRFGAIEHKSLFKPAAKRI